MKYSFTILILIFGMNLSFGQKLFLVNGKSRVRVKKGATVGITMKGENFYFGNWHFYGDACLDSAGYKNIWFVDSLGRNGVYANRFPVHQNDYGTDTVKIITKDLDKKHESWWAIDIIYEDTITYSNPKYIIQYPLFMERKLISMDSVQSLSFAKKKGENRTLTSSVIGAGFLVISGTVESVKNGILHEGNWAAIAGGLLWSAKIGISLHRSRIKTYDLTEWHVNFK